MKQLATYILLLTLFSACLPERVSYNFEDIESAFDCEIKYGTKTNISTSTSQRIFMADIMQLIGDSKSHSNATNNMIAVMLLDKLDQEDYTDITVATLYRNNNTIDTLRLNYKPDNLKMPLNKYRYLTQALDSSQQLANNYQFLVNKFDPNVIKEENAKHFVRVMKQADSVFGKVTKYKIQDFVSGHMILDGEKVKVIIFNGLAFRDTIEQVVKFTLFADLDNPYFDGVDYAPIRTKSNTQ